MKFVLKVLVLVFLVVMSKLSKDEAIALQKPIVKEIPTQSVFTSHVTSQQAPLMHRSPTPVPVKFEKGSLQIN